MARVRLLFVVLVCLMALQAAPCSARPQEAKDYLKHFAQFRQAYIRAHTEELIIARLALEQALLKPGPMQTRKEWIGEIEQRKQHVRERELALEVARVNAPTLLPSLHSLGMEVGQAGTLGHTSPHVLQVLGDKRMLVTLHDLDGHDFGFGGQAKKRAVVYVTGISTAKLVDGKKVSLPQLFKVTGTHRYETISGAVTTIFKLEPETEAEKTEREAAEQRAIAAKRAEDEVKERRLREVERKEASAAATKKAAEEDRRKAEAPAKAEAAARASLELTKELIRLAKDDLVKQRLERVIKQYPDTEAAKEARILLKKY